MTAAAPTPHDRYMQAASKIARIRTLMAELPTKLEEAKGELAEAVTELGSDPLNLIRTTNGKKDQRKPAELRELILGSLPGRADEVASRTGINSSAVNSALRRYLAKGDVTRSGESGRGGAGDGYVYRRVEQAEAE